MTIGATIVAEVTEVAVDGVLCATALDEKAIDKATIAIIEVIFFIVEKDLRFNYFSKEKESFLSTKQEVITA
tara:strand:- start:1107 stop:1322 length:216 start_codon:yes stop_codon:yes gene_type:complete